ncbi:hypothetical protein J6590_042416 [Homalodisca vitripennis]|nr:hypothetical protein J6590_042416 [Homalodisca vitripennis]
MLLEFLESHGKRSWIVIEIQKPVMENFEVAVFGWFSRYQTAHVAAGGLEVVGGDAEEGRRPAVTGVTWAVAPKPVSRIPRRPKEGKCCSR